MVMRVLKPQALNQISVHHGITTLLRRLANSNSVLTDGPFIRIMESSESKSVEIVLHTGGSWKSGERVSEYTPYNGLTLRQHVLKLPLGFRYIELMDNVMEPAMDHMDSQLGEGEKSLLLNYQRAMHVSDATYCNLFFRDDDFIVRFMDHVKTQLRLGKPIELYVGFLD